MTNSTTEAIARIIDPLCSWDGLGWRSGDDAREWAANKQAVALAKATAILALITPGEEFLEFKEALSDLRSLRHEYECLNGGGPGWSARNKAAWAKVDELFANEDEAAYDRQQQDAHG